MRYGDYQIMRILSQAETATEEYLLNAIQSQKEYIALALAPIANRKNLWEALLKDPRVRVRAELATNHMLDEETCATLAKETDIAVLSNLARNTVTPAAIVKNLAAHVNQFVRMNAATNPNLPVDDLLRLLEDDSAFVVEQATISVSHRKDTGFGDAPESIAKESLRRLLAPENRLNKLHRIR